MQSAEIVFKLIKENNCPFYKKGDEFRLSGNAILLSLKGGKHYITTAIIQFSDLINCCETLIGDLTNMLIQYKNIAKIPADEFDCSGCGGLVRLQVKKKKLLYPTTVSEPTSQDIKIASRLLSNFSIFQSIDQKHLKDIVSSLKLKKYSKGVIILKKGNPGKNLYIILSGSVDVIDEDGNCLRTLRKGDTFGEMSLVSGDSISATIKVSEPATVLFIEGDTFKEILNQFPSVQMYLTRMLSKRLANSKIFKAEEIASGMTGQFSEIPLSELLQAFSFSQKTGVLTCNQLSKGTAKIYLRDGDLIEASYNNIEGKEAFYAIFKESEGQFKFESKLPEESKNIPIIGSLVKMLLEASIMIDEKT
jgi:CRP-like cAMP-binding protein